VRLLTRSEYPEHWSPATDNRVITWECVWHMVRRLEEKGLDGAGELLHGIGDRGEDTRALAYRLYAICDRKGWTEDALALNGLVTSWPQIQEIAYRMRGAGTQTTLFG